MQTRKRNKALSNKDELTRNLKASLEQEKDELTRNLKASFDQEMKAHVFLKTQNLLWSVTQRNLHSCRRLQSR